MAKHICKRSHRLLHSTAGPPFPRLQGVAHSGTPQQLSRAEPQIASKNKLYQLEIIPLPKLRTVSTLCGMFLAAQFFEMHFLKYNIQNGFESKERESQLVETT